MKPVTYRLQFKNVSHFLMMAWLIAGMILPGAKPAWAETARNTLPATVPTSRSSSQAEDEKYFRLTKIVHEIQALQESDANLEAAKGKRKEAEALATELTLDLSKQFARIKNRQEEVNSEQLAELYRRQSYVNEMSGLGGLAVPMAILNDPKKAAGEDNIIRGDIAMAATAGAAADADSPAKINERLKNWGRAGYQGTMNFGNQYIIFSIAMGFIAMTQLSVNFKEHPNALEMWEKQTTDLLGVAGFGFFMLANHQTVKLLSKARNGTLPPSMINYIGMTVGSIASSAFHDLWTDKDVWACMKPYYDSKVKKDPAACGRMRKTWMAHNKILQYAPTIISMIVSTPLATAVRTAIASSIGQHMPKQQYVRVAIKGAQILPKAKWVRRGYYVVVGGVPGFAVAVGDMILFFAMDIFVTADPINQAWQDYRMNFTDMKAQMDKNWLLHHEFFFFKEGQLQPIENAFDVEATNPRSAHQYLMEMFNRQQATGWKKPQDTQACIPDYIKEQAKNVKPSDDKYWGPYLMKILWFQLGYNVKSQQQLSCEVHSRPLELISRYGDVNKDWRNFLLQKFNESQSNWSTMALRFTDVYDAYMKLARHLAEAKFNMNKKGAARPDLSREALMKVLGQQKVDDKHDQGGHGAKETSHYKILGNISTPEMVDYVVAGMACGPDLKKSADSEGVISKTWNKVYSYVGQTVNGTEFVKTPYGSSLNFVPPKITTGDREVCAAIAADPEYNWLGGEAAAIAASTPKNPFRDSVKDSTGQSFANLAEFVFEKMDPAVYEGTGNYSNFPIWFNDAIIKPIEPVWSQYAAAYDQLIDEKYMPILFSKSIRWGCAPDVDKNRVVKPAQMDAKDEEGFVAQSGKKTYFERNWFGFLREKQTQETVCKDSSQAYRVADGVFLSIEIELRNYLRGLYSLTMSSVPKDEHDVLKARYLEIANRMIEDVRLLDPEKLKSEEFEERVDDLEALQKALTDLATAQLRSQVGKIADADLQFKVEVLEKLTLQLEKLSAELKQHALVIEAMDFSSATARSSGQSVNSRGGSNSPLNRMGR